MQSVLQSFRWGAEFCIFKPLVDYGPLLDAVERTFCKIDHWWAALHHLTEEKRGATRTGAGSADTAGTAPGYTEAANSQEVVG
jgi:hypothetical protein